MTVLITLGCIVLAIVIFVLGFKTGYNACEEAQRRDAEQRRIGACLEHWHGHTTHKGHTIVSPLRDKEGDKR